MRSTCKQRLTDILFEVVVVVCVIVLEEPTCISELKPTTCLFSFKDNLKGLVNLYI